MSTRSRPGDGRPDPGLDAIMNERRQLINLTYRLLGSMAEALPNASRSSSTTSSATPSPR